MATNHTNVTKIELIDEAPKPGFMGHTIAFIKPESTMGTLWELVEDSH